MESRQFVALLLLSVVGTVVLGTKSHAEQSVCPDAENMALVAVDKSTGRVVCVDLFEGAIVAITANGTKYLNPFYTPVDSLVAYQAIAARDIKPQAYISAVQAQKACGAVRKRLCKLDEWMAACQGPNNYTYPYGNSYHPGYCNEGRSMSPVIQIFGPNATYSSKEMNDPRLDQLSQTVALGGQFTQCRSSYGAYDMHGNLHEWIDHINAGRNTGTFKGGFFVDAKINGPGCYYRTIAHAPSYHDYSTGFRCCADPLNA